MSMHRSLVSGTKGKQHRSVLKRYERIKTLDEKGKWKEDDTIFGLPKIKIVKIRIKKEKSTEVAAAITTGAGAASAAPAAASEAKAAPKKEAKKENK